MAPPWHLSSTKGTLLATGPVRAGASATIHGRFSGLIQFKASVWSLMDSAITYIKNEAIRSPPWVRITNPAA